MTTAAAETTTLLTLLIRSLVKDRDAVQVSQYRDTGTRTVFQVTVAPDEYAKGIGNQGRTPKCLRHLLTCMGQESKAGTFALETMAGFRHTAGNGTRPIAYSVGGTSQMSKPQGWWDKPLLFLLGDLLWAICFSRKPR